jgi:diaminohydroxyphosphoribosylaminopyrimidine deaminase/5-amino-6-(5-phosphoribosylamino)uracil reductase
VAGFSPIDDSHMRRALALARRGLYTTRPNPRVGCVIAHGDEVVGEGWTAPTGGPHAEVRALEVASGRARGATVYVTLEPCSHFGRTPPCADALVQAAPARVVVAVSDPFERVDGSGMARLRAAGIVVDVGLLAEEAIALNAGFFSLHQRGRPWVRLKVAASLDGRTAMASGESRWITGPAARRDVQHLRARSCAIVTGVGTVLADDPRLTLRRDELDDLDAFDLDFLAANPPLRVVLDRSLRTPVEARLLKGGALLYTAADASAPPAAALVAAGAEIETVPAAAEHGVDLAAVLAELARRDLNELLLECGPGLAGTALRAGLVDELWLYLAPVLMGAGARPLADLSFETMAERMQLRLRDVAAVGEDLRLVLTPPEGRVSAH